MSAPYWVYATAAGAATLLSRRAAHRVADILSGTAFSLCAARREAARDNLKNAGADASDTTVRQVFRNFGRYCADFVHYTRRGAVPPRVRFESGELLRDALGRKRGAIILSAHLGNWELGAAALADAHPVSVVVHEHPDPATNAFFNRRRKARGVKPIPVGSAFRQCLRALSEGEVVGLLGDRRYGSDGAEVEFFGRRTLLPRGPSILSVRSGAPIVGATMLPDGDGGFVMRFTEIARPEDHDEDAYNLETVRVLERLIRPNAAHWLVFDSVWPATAGEPRHAADCAR